MQVSENSQGQGQGQGPVANGSVTEDFDITNTVSVKETTAVNKEEVAEESIPEESNSNDSDVTFGEQVVYGEAIDTSSDEGWQEANSKVRSANANANDNKFRRRRPNHLKVRVKQSKENGQISGVVPRDQQRMMNQNVIIKESSPQKKSRAQIQSKKVSSVVPTTLTAMASKAFSYKEVAMSPPGTILKPLAQKEEATIVEENKKVPESSKENGEKNDVEVVKNTAEEYDKVSDDSTDSSQPRETAVISENEEVSGLDSQEKVSESKGSKLSASAQPFNPTNYGGVTNFYDVRVSQGLLLEPVEFPPITARVACGPRSPLYYRTNHYAPVNKPGLTLMNPDAPEFVPQKLTSDVISSPDAMKNVVEFDGKEGAKDDRSKKSTSEAEKAELARQILLSFIVKSVQNSSDRSNESSRSVKKSTNWQNSSEAIANDSSIIKIFQGNEEKADEVVKSMVSRSRMLSISTKL